MAAADPLAPFRLAPADAGLFLDFDGTLAPIVPSAEAARPLPGVGDLLADLVGRFGVVAIVSGRPVAFLREHLPPMVELYGLYGLESVLEGELAHHPEAFAWQGVVDQVVADAHSSGPAVDVEHKGMSLTLHFRRHPKEAAAAEAWAAEAADRSGLLLRHAKMSIELHPPVAVDKGSIVEARAAGCAAALYAGDDAGDLPAFAALDRLSERGVASLKVAVQTPDASPALLAAADLQVDGPAGAVDLLRQLIT